MMAALPDILYIHTFTLRDDEKSCYETTKYSNPIPIAKARTIRPLNDTLVVIQCNSDVVVYNLNENKKIINIDFKQYIFSQITAWDGWIAIEKGRSTLIRASSPCDWEWHSPLKNN